METVKQRSYGSDVLTDSQESIGEREIPAPAAASIAKKKKVEERPLKTTLSATVSATSSATSSVSSTEPPKLHSVAAKALAKAGLISKAVITEKDYHSMDLSSSHDSKPFWLLKDGQIILDSSSEFYKEACEFLVAISEPVCRTKFLQEYKLTNFSLYAAASMGLKTEEILSRMEIFSKTGVPTEVEEQVRTNTERYGKVKLVLQKDRLYIECAHHPKVLEELMQDPVLKTFRVERDATEQVEARQALAVPPQEGGDTSGSVGMEVGAGSTGAATSEEAQAQAEEAARAAMYLDVAKLATEEEESTERLVSFEVDATKVKEVKERCSKEIDWPLMEEYDFRNDTSNPELPIELKSDTAIREYQSKALSRMFSNHRARSGIIVLPCGAGKTLVGIVAATTVKRSCLVLCNSTVSVEQWYQQFRMWTQIDDAHITKFTATCKEMPHPDSCILVSTYNMISFSGRRA